MPEDPSLNLHIEQPLCELSVFILLCRDPGCFRIHHRRKCTVIANQPGRDGWTFYKQNPYDFT